MYNMAADIEVVHLFQLLRYQFGFLALLHFSLHVSSVGVSCEVLGMWSVSMCVRRECVLCTLHNVAPYSVFPVRLLVRKSAHFRRPRGRQT